MARLNGGGGGGPIAITDTFVVNSQVQMLALTAQTGDVAVRTDSSETYILQGTDPTVLGDWVQLLFPSGLGGTGAAGQIGVFSGASFVQGYADFKWDNTNHNFIAGTGSLSGVGVFKTILGQGNTDASDGYNIMGGKSTSIPALNEGFNIIVGDTHTIAGAGAGFSGVFGGGNTVSLKYNLVGGNGQSITGGWALAGGLSNTVSGSHGTVGGKSNTITANFATAFGEGNSVSGIAWGFAAGHNNTVGYVAGAIGNVNNATGVESFAAGYSNTASGAESIALGAQNTASNTHAVALCWANVASGLHSLATGEGSRASDRASSSFGRYANARMPATMSLQGYFTGSTGDHQTSVTPLFISTPDATPLEMKITEIPEFLSTLDGRAYLCRLSVVARNGALATETAGYTLDFVFDRGAGVGTCRISGITKNVVHEDVAAWDVTVTADLVNGRPAVTVTGEVAKTIRWSGRMEMTEVA